MASRTPSILPLPPKVAAQIESSTSITSLNSAILGLVKNSLDADAQTVAITVDFQKGGCAVEDDGEGIPASEFEEGGGLGKLHHTSKLNSLREVYGCKGVFLPSLASLALLTVTSRHGPDSSTNSVTYHHSTTISRLCPAPPHHEFASEHGTKVTVTNLFGNLPVRVKHRALTLQKDEEIDREWDDLKRLLTGLLIASTKWPKVILEDVARSRKLILRGRKERPGNLRQPTSYLGDPAIDLAQIRSVLSQAGYITSTDPASWVTASARASGIFVQSAISLTPSPTKQAQFISFGINPLNQQFNANVLYDEVNRLFAASSFGSEDSSTPEIAEELRGLNLKDSQRGRDTPVEKRHKARAKGVNRWPVFYIRINLTGQDTLTGEQNGPLSSEKSLEGILNVLVAMIRQFLEQYHFSRPRNLRGEKRTRDLSALATVEERLGKRPRSCAVIPSSSCSVVAEPIPSVHEEFLNSRVKLPNYAGSSIASPGYPKGDFTNWTRVKVGSNKNIQEQIRSELAQERRIPTETLNRRPENEVQEGLRPLSSLSAPVSMQSRPSSRSPTCATPKIQSEEQAPFSIDGEADSLQQGPRDNIIQWTDPLTKEALNINERTGQTLPTNGSKRIPFRSISLSSRQPRTYRADGSRPSSPTPWIDSVLQKWKNPVFGPFERPIPSIRPATPNQLEQENTRLSGVLPIAADFENACSSSFTGRLTKSGLTNAQIVAQVDNKFILLRMIESLGDKSGFQRILVLVDQHAADERIRVERLFDELCGSSPSHTVDTTPLPEPILFKVSSEEARLFESRTDYFASWGCSYSTSRDKSFPHAIVEVTTLPTLIFERCRAEPKLAIDLLRSEIWARKDDKTTSKPKVASAASASAEEVGGGEPTSAPHWPHSISHCPRGIIDLLNSRACRSAIMFNDKLSKKECKELISTLAKCVFPFQCAHGRPSMVPTMSLGYVDGDHAGSDGNDGITFGGFGCDPRKEEVGFAKAFGDWEKVLTQ
ncbi:DNA mismatch repair protein [Coccidioides immitis]|nr:DNA mismatch repair protein [Coccidioides immitis]